ncbi:helix-turn-helix transcriptional regulator [Marinobacter nauticus]|uniref:helix-turn-helix transcriptional regulator n=1 Tax=Marinobacter nauticus TaxID=2743 RepID=UPI001CFD68AB|nr:PAS domain-containing protein [Marinobacter nauticus]
MNEIAYTTPEEEVTDRDREFLASYFRLADTVADFIGPHCEVVIHSLDSLENSVVKIVNGHNTGRQVNSPITDLGLKMLSRFRKTGEVAPKSFFHTDKNGAMIKSTTCVLAGERGNPIGLFCINMNLSKPFPEILKTMMPDMANALGAIHENFSESVTETIEQSIIDAMAQVDNDPSVNLRGRNKAIARVLFDNGIFELKEATAQVAEQLGVTRHAIYKYIREFKS